MNWLLLPRDEADLVTFLVDDLGLKLLGDDTAPDGIPRVVQSPLDALPESLPLPAKPLVENAIPREFVFWCSDLGPVRTLEEAPAPDDARDRVALSLARETGEGWTHLIDLARTPVIRFARSHWRDDSQETLIPGRLMGMPVRVKDQPDVSRLLARVERWLKKEGEKFNPFEHCRTVEGEQPRSLSGYWVWARPNASRWVREGGEVWPWTA